MRAPWHLGQDVKVVESGFSSILSSFLVASPCSMIEFICFLGSILFVKQLNLCYNYKEKADKKSSR